MKRIYKKEYNVLLSSFISRAFFGTILISSVFACGGASKEELEEVENKAKFAKEETEKVKKELGDKITALESRSTALEGKAPADVNAAQYANIQAAVGLNADGTLDATKANSLAAFKTAIQAGLELDDDCNSAKIAGLDSDIAALKAFNANLQESIGLDDDCNLDANKAGSLAAFKAAIQIELGIDDDYNSAKIAGLDSDITDLKAFKEKIKESIGLNDDGTLNANEGMAGDISRINDRIVKGVNALGSKIKNKPQIVLGEV